MDKTQKLMVFAIDDKLRTITMPNNVETTIPDASEW